MRRVPHRGFGLSSLRKSRLRAGLSYSISFFIRPRRDWFFQTRHVEALGNASIEKRLSCRLARLPRRGKVHLREYWAFRFSSRGSSESGISGVLRSAVRRPIVVWYLTATASVAYSPILDAILALLVYLSHEFNGTFNRRLRFGACSPIILFALRPKSLLAPYSGAGSYVPDYNHTAANRYLRLSGAKSPI